MKNIKKEGFTLVELIVVITILAILGTIAFISFQGYTRNARDGVRSSDIASLTKTLELFISEKGIYPEPSNFVNILYSGATVWSQGHIGDSVILNLKTINKKPVDPVFSNEYTYSVNAYKNEFQLASIAEGQIQANNNLFINSTYASLSQPIAYIKGTYNGKITITNTGGVDYVFALPSIVANDVSSNDLMNIIDNKKLIYSNLIGMPSSYSGYIDSNKNDFIFLSSGSSVIVFSGVLSTDLYGEGLFSLVDNLHLAYSGSIINPYSNDIGKDKSDLANYTWETIRKIYGLPKLSTTKSCEELLVSGKSEGDGFYHFFAGDNSTIYQTYCDMTNGGWTFLFSANPSGTKWKYDSIEWTKPTVTMNMNSYNILADELTSGAYGEFKGNEVKICRGSFSNCYIFKHNQNRTLKSFYNIGDKFIVYTKCYPDATYCDAGQLPDDVGDDTERALFLSIAGVGQTYISPYVKQGLGINLSTKNKLGVQFDNNNTWPDFDNMGYGIGVFRSWNCGYTGVFVDNTRARSVEGTTSCAYLTPDPQMWYVFSK